MTSKRDGFGGVVTATRARVERPGRAAHFVLTVVEGADAGKSFTVNGSQPSRVLVGQSPVCDLVLSDREVSRRHLALDVREGRLRITDLESTNGTSVNGLAIADAFVAGGEVIRLGQTAMRVDRAAAAGAGAARAASVPPSGGFGRVVGASPEMRRLYPLCERIAASNVPVVIEGETGTGKEALAESLHERSPRAKGPFVVFDCTALPGSLLEAALFGHERGAFTGATDTRVGVFEEAHGGTLLIDEIGELGVDLQAKLLRALERSEVRRLGGRGWLHVDVRVIAATRRDLDALVQAGRFRDDLFFRLAVARIELPPLRARRGDVALLAQHFWAALGGPPPGPPAELLLRIEADPWPGNVRELRNAIARQIALGELADDASARAGASRPPPAPSAAPAPRAAPAGDDPFHRVLAMDLPLPRARQRLVDEFERAYVERVLARHGGSVARAAEASGLARRYFQLLRARQSAR